MQAGARRCLSCCCSDRCHHHCHRCGFSSQSLLASVLCRQQGWSYLVGGGCWVPSTCWSVKGSKCAPRSARPGLHVVVSRWCHLTPFLLCAHMSFFFIFLSCFSVFTAKSKQTKVPTVAVSFFYQLLLNITSSFAYHFRTIRNITQFT